MIFCLPAPLSLSEARSLTMSGPPCRPSTGESGGQAAARHAAAGAALPAGSDDLAASGPPEPRVAGGSSNRDGGTSNVEPVRVVRRRGRGAKNWKGISVHDVSYNSERLRIIDVSFLPMGNELGDLVTQLGVMGVPARPVQRAEKRKRRRATSAEKKQAEDARRK